MSRGTDPTLRQGTAGLEVLGRGEHHQIDAIAEFTIRQPFVNPTRLLVEAMSKDAPVGIEIVRNTVGVLEDASEYWVIRPLPDAAVQLRSNGNNRATATSTPSWHRRDLPRMPRGTQWSMIFISYRLTEMGFFGRP